MTNYREVNKLANDFHEKYGGMMTLSDVAVELGRASRETAKKWLMDHEVPGVQVGVYPRWESRLVAKAIVALRGFC